MIGEDMNEVNEGYHGHLFSNEDKDALDPAKPASGDSEEEEVAEDTKSNVELDTTLSPRSSEPLESKTHGHFDPFGRESGKEDKRYI